MQSPTSPTRNREIKRLIRNIYKKAVALSAGKKRFQSLRGNFIRILKSKGFTFFDDGGYKEVFYNEKKYPEFLVKVFRYSYGHREDSCFKRLPVWIKKYFLLPVASNHLYFIQAKVNEKPCRTRGFAYENLYSKIRIKSRVSWAMVRDINMGNVLFHDGKPVIIDFCKD